MSNYEIGEVGAAVLPAFERAAARALQTAAELSPNTAAPLECFLGDLQTAVRETLAGNDFALRGQGVPPGGTTLLERVRRYFTEEIRAEPATHTFGAVHIYSALALVQCATSNPNAGRTGSGAAALDLTVEAAHDMRSPLSAILFLVDMLRTGRSGAVTATQQQQLGMVYGAALGLNLLACDLIDFVRGESGMIDIHPSPFTLGALLHGIRDMVNPAAAERGVDVQLVFPDDRVHVGQPAALSRILLNLVTNAIRHTDGGIVIAAARELTPTRLEFSVQDGGREIPPPTLEQLFQPFRLSAGGVRAFSSSGLGLVICHRLVAALGGELRVSTAFGLGARFYFELDLAPAGAELVHGAGGPLSESV